MHPRHSSLRYLFFSLVLGLLNALVFVFLVPPWQHYDEPKHFEYLWLLIHRGAPPQKGDFDAQLSREVIASMLEHGFWGDEDMSALLYRPDELMTIPGYSQLEEPVAYYWWASLPLRWIKTSAVESQLYVARLMSVVLFLLILVVGWVATLELTVPASALRWMVPLSMALLPGFVDVMSAVNNDVLAVLGYSVFLWGAIRLLKRPFSLINLAWCILAAIACLFLKSTSAFAIILLPLVLVFAVFRSSRPFLVIAGVSGSIVLICFGLLRWDDALYWHRGSSQAQPLRQQRPEAVLGEQVLALEVGARVTPKWSVPVYQLIPEENWDQLVGKRLTLGGWMWATREIEVEFLAFVTPQAHQSQRIKVGLTPQFFSMWIDGPVERSRVWIEIDPIRESGECSVFFDGFVMALGERPLNDPPLYASPFGEFGEWGGEPFENLLRNASFEKAAPRVHPWVDNFAAAYLPDEMRPSMVLSALLDLPATGYLYRLTAPHLFRTFWGRFGWGHVPLYFFKFLGRRPYFYLGLVTLVALLGAFLAALRRLRTWHWEIGFVLGVALLIPWLITLLRGTVFLPLPRLYFSVARHALVSILPVMLLLNTGWREIGRIALRSLRHYAGETHLIPVLRGLYLFFFVAMNAYAYFSIAKFYRLFP